jgi:hypothetical protein
MKFDVLCHVHSPARAIDYSPELGRIVVGTSNCDINELTETTTVSR